MVTTIGVSGSVISVGRGTFGNIAYGSATILSGTVSVAVNLSGLIDNVSGSPKSVVVSVNTSGFGDLHYIPSNFVSGSFTIYGVANTSADVAVSYVAMYLP